jgi:hypothetical protein
LARTRPTLMWSVGWRYCRHRSRRSSQGIDLRRRRLRGTGGCRRTRRGRRAGRVRNRSFVAVQGHHENHRDDANDPRPHRAATAVLFKIEPPELIRLARAIRQRIRMFGYRHVTSPRPRRRGRPVETTRLSKKFQVNARPRLAGLMQIRWCAGIEGS